MKGYKFTGRKQHSEGNQVLFSVLQHSHQNQTALAPVATTSPTTVVPGLVLTGRKALEHHPSASQSKFTVRPDAPVLKLYSCQVSPCRNFYGWTEPHAGSRSSPDKQLITALISGLKLTNLFLLGLWNKRGQNNSPHSIESLLDGFVLRLNEPQLLHIKEVKSRTILTSRDIKHEFKTSFEWSPFQPSRKYAQSLSFQLVPTASWVQLWHDN